MQVVRRFIPAFVAIGALACAAPAGAATMTELGIDNGHEVLGHISGKMRRHYIRILPGDRVKIELSPYDLDRGRITYRHK